MWLTSIEPDKPGHDRRTFECPRCQHLTIKIIRYRDESETGGVTRHVVFDPRISGIFQIACGDFQPATALKARICNSETIAEFRKRRVGGLLRGNSLSI
jgi:hypothetical protein